MFMSSDSLSNDTSVELEIELPITRPLKQSEKEEILRELNSTLSSIKPIKVEAGGYRERHGAGLPIELIVNVTTLLANAVAIATAVAAVRRWLLKAGEEQAGINVKVDNQGYSIRNCRTSEDVAKIIREIKRK